MNRDLIKIMVDMGSHYHFINQLFNGYAHIGGYQYRLNYTEIINEYLGNLTESFLHSERHQSPNEITFHLNERIYEETLSTLEAKMRNEVFIVENDFIQSVCQEMYMGLKQIGLALYQTAMTSIANGYFDFIYCNLSVLEDMGNGRFILIENTHGLDGYYSHYSFNRWIERV